MDINYFDPQILTGNETVNFAVHSLGMPYSVVTADQGCRTEMVKINGNEIICR